MNEIAPTPAAPPREPGDLAALREGRVGSPLLPVGEDERLITVDAIRGMALLGILMVNIWTFSAPFVAMMNPAHPGLRPYLGEFDNFARATWFTQHLFFDMKMMSIFSMLFGAGLVLMADRAGQRRTSFAGIYYRRILWLLAIGLFHGYILWYGDILVVYALCGLMLYPLRKLRPRMLLLISIPVLLLPMLFFVGMGWAIGWMRGVADQAQAIITGGGTPPPFKLSMLDGWSRARAGFDPTAEQVREQVETMRGPLPQVVAANALITLSMHLQMLPLWGIWRAGGLMLIGMALMKTGVFAGRRSTRFYTTMLLLGYGLGLPILALSALDQLASGFEPVRVMMLNWNINYAASIGVALGHIALLVLIIRAGVLRGLTDRLASVGRMALTNYLAQTLIATTFFFGWGFGFFASLERPWLILMVFSIWALQLAWSPLWLTRYRYGPAEWLWRSLTYLKPQPLGR